MTIRKVDRRPVSDERRRGGDEWEVGQAKRRNGRRQVEAEAVTDDLDRDTDSPGSGDQIDRAR
jgi:hypothetical protein